MARIGVSLKVDSSATGNFRFSKVAHALDPLNTASVGADKAAFETPLATLVADGATPTQAHVTAVNNAYTTLKGDLGAYPTGADDVVVSINTTNCPSISCLRAALDRLLSQLSGTSWFTP